MTTRAVGRHFLETIARALGSHLDAVVFVGGLAIPLLITDPGADGDRPTDDVDVIVEAAVTPVPWYAFTSSCTPSGSLPMPRRTRPSVDCVTA